MNTGTTIVSSALEVFSFFPMFTKWSLDERNDLGKGKVLLVGGESMRVLSVCCVQWVSESAPVWRMDFFQKFCLVVPRVLEHDYCSSASKTIELSPQSLVCFVTKNLQH